MSFHNPQTPQSPGTLLNSGVTSNSAVVSSNTLPTPEHSITGTSIPGLAHDAMPGDSPHKRKRSPSDVGNREHKKVQIETRSPGIRDLHIDVGEKYLLLRTPTFFKAPTCTQDLFKAYGLTSVAADVARVLPDGTKNALRKTYKGQMKKLGLGGHFDPVKKEANRADGFLAMMGVPDQEWDVQFVRGREIGNGLSKETRAMMPQALTLAKGLIPKKQWDSSVLGPMAPGKERQPASARPTAPNTPSGAALAGSRKQQAALAQEAARPKRANKKRSYNEASFEGYGDGFPDDDVQGSGYSANEGDGAQKRKKSRVGNHVMAQARTPNYGSSLAR